MTVFRILLSIALFTLAFLAMYDVLFKGFNQLYFGIAIGSFLLAVWIWPIRRQSSRPERNTSSGLEWFELLFELILWPLRFLGHIIKHLFD